MNLAIRQPSFNLNQVVPRNEEQRNYLTQAAGMLHAQPGTTESQILGIGAAGTGKTYLNMAIVAAAIQMGHQVACAAPTHKALNILRESARKYGIASDVSFVTVQRLLGLTLDAGENGKQLVETNAPMIGWYNLVMADEGSMLNRGVWNYMQPRLSNTLFLGTGDPAQLYPVGEGLSPFFKSDIRQVKLTQPVRQAEGPLMDVVTAARRAVTAKKNRYHWFKPDLSAINADGGKMRVSRKGLIAKVLDNLDQIREDPNHLRIVAFRNDTVDRYNQAIRRQVLGPNAPQYVVGERLLAKDRGVNSHENKRETLVHTAMEMEVLKAEETYLDGYVVWKLRVQVEGETYPKEIYALHADDQDRFDQECQELKAAAIRNRYLWRNYYQHLERFPNLKQCYALTTHYCQGSTYATCGVDIKDFNAWRYIPEGSALSRARNYNRHCYVGLGRAAESAHYVL